MNGGSEPASASEETDPQAGEGGSAKANPQVDPRALPVERRVRWSRAWRVIPSRYPPIQLFERLGDPSEWDAIAAIEGLTNPRVRQEIGEISVVPVAERVSGPGASWVMASFTHIGHPSRFSDGRYGVYYAARTRATAIEETAWHMGRFYSATREAPLDVDMRTLVGRLDGTFHDLRDDPRFAAVHDPGDYTAAQSLGRRLRDAGSNGVVYASVRHPGGECVGAFRPKAVPIPTQGSHLRYHWDGRRIDRYFDYGEDQWVERPA